MELLGRELGAHRADFGIVEPNPNRTMPWSGRRMLSICGRPLSGKGKRWDRCCAWSDAVICPAFDAAGRDSRRPVWEFADWVQITRSVLEAQWKALVVPAPS